MKVEIWSDIMCPFCYLGKKNFEKALSTFEGRDRVEIEWKSYQLMPDMKTDTGIRLIDFLERSKGWSRSDIESMNRRIVASGKEAGIDYRFEKVVVANSFKAHNFLHYAKTEGKQNEAGEKLFLTYFTEGKNIDDAETLGEIGRALGFSADEMQKAIETSGFANEVRDDIDEAERLNVTGVPYFVFNRKYAISGAQPAEVFLETLNKVFQEMK